MEEEKKRQEKKKKKDRSDGHNGISDHENARVTREPNSTTVLHDDATYPLIGFCEKCCPVARSKCGNIRLDANYPLPGGTLRIDV